ncbi:MAG: UPF0280 family protein [Rhodospirillales bacterium]
MSGAQVALLPDGRRLHLHHGPIDLIVEAFGSKRQVAAAYRSAAQRFDRLLDELVAELPDLRKAVNHDDPLPDGAIAQAMTLATRDHLPAFITPMAAVAGAVADAILAAMTDVPDLERAYVNNGGDIALYLSPGSSLTVSIAGLPAQVTLPAESRTRGLATSGWRGRSWSRGIADSVTVLASSGARADAAATIIANAVDLPGHPSIQRAPASSVELDNELGDRLVTMWVGKLSKPEVEQALRGGLRAAERLAERGVIEGAVLALAGRVVCHHPSNDLLIPAESLSESLHA